MCNGLMMIYMGPDGTDFGHMWGTLNEDVSDSGMVALTLCQQLGYDKGQIYGKTMYKSFQVSNCIFQDKEINL